MECTLTDVSKQLEAIEKRQDRQDDLLVGVSNSLVELVRVSERQIAQSERSEERYGEIHKEFVRVNDRIDKVETRSNTNHDKLSQAVGIWVGVSVSCGVIFSMLKVFHVL